MEKEPAAKQEEEKETEKMQTTILYRVCCEAQGKNGLVRACKRCNEHEIFSFKVLSWFVAIWIIGFVFCWLLPALGTDFRHANCQIIRVFHSHPHLMTTYSLTYSSSLSHPPPSLATFTCTFANHNRNSSSSSIIQSRSDNTTSCWVQPLGLQHNEKQHIEPVWPGSPDCDTLYFGLDAPLNPWLVASWVGCCLCLVVIAAALVTMFILFRRVYDANKEL